MFYKALQSCPWAKVSFKHCRVFSFSRTFQPASARHCQGVALPKPFPSDTVLRWCSMGLVLSQHSPTMPRCPCPTQMKRRWETKLRVNCSADRAGHVRGSASLCIYCLRPFAISPGHAELPDLGKSLQAGGMGLTGTLRDLALCSRPVLSFSAARCCTWMPWSTSQTSYRRSWT